jgi:penicillin-binding protein 1A
LTHGVSPLEMTRAYTTINTGGERIKPVAIRKVIRADGSVDTSVARQNRKRVFTDGQAYEAIKAMEANVQRGTGTRAGLSGCPAAGKTGTTSEFVDAWFDGFTTNLNTAVWVGYPKGSIPMRAVPYWGEMFGGRAPASIWHDFMQVAATKVGAGCKPFPQPKQPFESQPFFGHYATNGPPGGAIDPLNRTPPTDPATQDKNGKGKDKKAGGKGDGTGGNGFDPQKYESPPQSPPNTQAPAGTTPDSGGGGGTTAPAG